MSANRGTTRCDCDQYYFSQHVLVADLHDAITHEQLCARVGDNSGHGWEHGYRRHMEGGPHMWRSPDGTRFTGSSHHAEHDFIGVLFYETIAPQDRYRWARVRCPVCFREYMGWYMRHPVRLDGPSGPEAPVYYLQDTSYYWSFADAPNARDREGVRAATKEIVQCAVDEWYGQQIRLNTETIVKALDAYYLKRGTAR